jgi:hypothetical protein
MFMNFVVLGILGLWNFRLTSWDFSYLRGPVPWFRRDFQFLGFYGQLKNEG